MQRRSANARYPAACAALATLAALPIATTLALWSHSLPAGVVHEFAAVQTFALHCESSPRRIDLLAALQRWALSLWGAGVLVLSAHLVWTCRAVSLLKNSGEPAAAASRPGAAFAPASGSPAPYASSSPRSPRA